MTRATCFLLAVLSTLPLSAQAQNFVESPLFPGAKPATNLDKVFKYAAWPGYGIVEQDPLHRNTAEKITLVGERAAFAFDFGTTARGLSTNSTNAEGNPLNTVFGSQNKAGVLTSMTSWELGYSYSAAVVPRWFEGTRYRKPVRIAIILAGAYLAEEHVRTGFCNIRILRESQPMQTQSCGQW